MEGDALPTMPTKKAVTAPIRRFHFEKNKAKTEFAADAPQAYQASTIR